MFQVRVELTAVLPRGWSVVVILLSASISFSKLLGFREVLGSHSSGDPHNLAMGFEENGPLSQLYIQKLSQNFSQLRLSKLLVLMEEFLCFGEESRQPPLNVL